MKLITFLVLLCALSVRADSMRGDIKSNYSESMFADNVFKKEFGTVVKATTSWHAGEFFGQETVLPVSRSKILDRSQCSSITMWRFLIRTRT